MKADTQHQESAHSFSRRTGVVPFVWHPPQDFFGDLAVLADRTWRFEHRQDGLEGITMNAGNAIDLFDPATGVFVHAVAGGRPI